jgi:glycosyltransferase involved in cell wall biosynthesis
MMKLFITIPAYNEAKGFLSTLESLLLLDDQDFGVVICDNNSTDNTREIAETFIQKNNLDWTVVTEVEKGTGAAADTAIRAAIRLGATHVARTDADCIPSKDWVSVIKRTFNESDVKMIAGNILPRTDDINVSAFRKFVLTNMVPLASWFGRVRPSNKGPQYKGDYVMVAGCNVAITTDLYEEVGGFTRTRIEDAHEDRALVNAVREVTADYGYFKESLIYCSARRVEAWGVVRTLGWYANHYYRPEKVDIR